MYAFTSLDKAYSIANAADEQKEAFCREREQMETKKEELEKEIEELRKELAIEREEVGQKEQRQKIVTRVLQVPSRAESSSALTQLQAELDGLVQEGTRATQSL